MSGKLISGHLLVLLAVSAAGAAPRQAGQLPYDRTNPIMYDNDWTNDYIDWYLMALASAGDIQYRGLSTSSSIPPYNRYMTADGLTAQVQERTVIVTKGRNSGFRNVPDPVPGTRGHLVKPASGRIEDTVPIDSAGSRAILAEARKATAAKPLVVCLGGPATAVADAYLLDNSIADKVVVGFVSNHADGLYGFNGWSDGWAAYIALQRLRLVVFPLASGNPIPRLSKTWIENNLPDSEARDYMLALSLDVVNGNDGDADGMPAVAIMRSDYVQQVKRVSFGGWRTRDGHEMPLFKDDSNGRALVVTQASASIATQEYQRAFTNPAAWNSAPPSPPAAPGGLGATAVSSSRIDLAWTDNSDDETGFEIDRAASPSGPWTRIATTGSNTTAYQDTGLFLSTTYSYRVRATNGGGDSANSNTASATTTAGAPPPPGSGPALHWTLDEGSGTTAVDASGNGHDATLRNGAAWTSGQAGGGVLLDGVNDFLETADAPGLDLSGAVTVALWYRYDGKTDGWGRIAVKDWGSPSAPWTAYGLTLDDAPEGSQKVSFSVARSSTQTAGVTSLSTLAVGSWVHLAGVFDPAAGTVGIYVNGVRENNSAAPISTVADSTGPFLVGSASWSNHRIKGAVDDVYVYGRALSAAEIAGLASTAQPGPGPEGSGSGSRSGGSVGCGATGLEVLLLLTLVRRRRRA